MHLTMVGPEIGCFVRLRHTKHPISDFFTVQWAATPLAHANFWGISLEEVLTIKERIHIAGLPGSPLGELWAAVSERGLAALDMQVEREAFIASLHKRGYALSSQRVEMAAEALRQVVEYLEGKRRSFDFAIDWECLRPFQRQVLQETCAIPYGETATYAEIAARIGKPRAPRAVGRAQATNPMPLAIPCHRVLGSDGKLHGYGAGEGLKTKAWLLRMEAENNTSRRGR
jgi:methylated-DNA-[protein]-cysteine S-methyltransferase